MFIAFLILFSPIYLYIAIRVASRAILKSLSEFGRKRDVEHQRKKEESNAFKNRGIKDLTKRRENDFSMDYQNINNRRK